MHSLLQPSIDADETLPEGGFASISEMIAETLATMPDREEPAWPDVLAAQRTSRDAPFTKTF